LDRSDAHEPFSLLLGLVDWEPFVSAPPSNPITVEALSKSLVPILGGAGLAILLGQWSDRLTFGFARTAVAMVAPTRRATLALSSAVERIDATIRQWPVACLSLLSLVLLFSGVMLAAR